MSIVIGVCGEGFCTLFSDNWSIVPADGSWMVRTESTQKIFRINERLILGATGVFEAGEDICGPLRGLGSPENLRLTEASAALIQFMDQDHKRLQLLEHRNYLLGGVNLRGQLCLWQLHFNAQLGYTEIATYQPDRSHRYGTVLSLPFSRSDRQRYWLNCIHYATVNCRTQDQLIFNMTQIIRDLHAGDRTTGDEVQYQSIALP